MSEPKHGQNRKHDSANVGNLLVSGHTERYGRKQRSAFAMVLTGTPFAYRRDDGVVICPLGTLGP